MQLKDVLWWDNINMDFEGRICEDNDLVDQDRVKTWASVIPDESPGL